jgi:hypothetical protein
VVTLEHRINANGGVGLVFTAAKERRKRARMKRRKKDLSSDFKTKSDSFYGI